MADNFTISDEEVDRLYESYKKYVDIESILSISEMDHFAPLFSKANRQAYNDLSESFTANVEADLQALSNEYLRTVDPYKPVYVVPDDVKQDFVDKKITHAEAKAQNVYILPPVFLQLHNAESNRRLIDAFSNMCSNDDKNANSPTGLRLHEIRHAIGQTIAAAQSMDQITEKAMEFHELSEQFNQKMLNKGERQPVTVDTKQSGSNGSDLDQFLDFD